MAMRIEIRVLFWRISFSSEFMFNVLSDDLGSLEELEIKLNEYQIRAIQ